LSLHWLFLHSSSTDAGRDAIGQQDLF